MKAARILIAVTVVIVATFVSAADLATAKEEGLVGEQTDGYLGLVQASPSTEIRDLVDDVNARRRIRYQAIADENGITLKAVQQRAGHTSIQKTRRGHYVKVGGSWQRKSLTTIPPS